MELPVELVDQKIKMLVEFRNNRQNKRKGKDAVLTARELFGRLVVGDQFGVIRVWQKVGEVMERTQKLIGHSHAVRCSTILDLNNYIVASGSEGELNSIRIWNTADGTCLATLKHHKATVSALVSLQNTFLVSASYDGQLCLWDINKKQLIKEIDAHGYPILCMQKSADERFVMTGADDYSIRIWETGNFGMVAACRSQTGSVTSLCNVDEGRFASGSSGGEIKIWSLANIALGRIDPEDLKIKAHQEAVTGMTYLRRRDWLVSVSQDRSMKIWHPRLGSLLRYVPHAHPNSIACVTHCQQQSTLVTGCWDGLIRLWELP